MWTHRYVTWVRQQLALDSADEIIRLSIITYFSHSAAESTLAIHREAPPFVDQSTEMQMLVTGIKVNCQSSF